jgi:dihydroxy-acid dehydratase
MTDTRDDIRLTGAGYSPREHSSQTYDGPDRAGARAMLYAMGIDDEHRNRPHIGVAATWNRVTPCNAGLDVIRARAAAVLDEADLLPLEFDTIGVSDGISMGSPGMRASLASRDWIADSVELVALAQGFDGLFAIAGCDKTIPGMLLAMVRLDLPAVYAYAGSKLPGHIDGRDISLQDVYEAVGLHQAGQIDDEQLSRIERTACPGIGTCAGMFSANTMSSLAEGLGLTVPGMASPPAEHPDRLAITSRAAEVLADAVRAGRRPSDILTYESFENAATLVSTLGGSTNGVLHLLALAVEAGIPFTLRDIDRISRRTPQLADMKPAGHYMMRDLHAAGGVPMVLAELLRAGLVHGDALTVTGRTLAEEVADIPLTDEPVVSRADHPHKPSGGYVALFGNLAPDGAVSKVANQSLVAFTGPARCFDTEHAAAEGARDGRIRAGDVVVIRYEGPVGGPGMPEMTAFTGALIGAGIGRETAVVTDGRFGGGTQGLAIGHVSPEAASGGPIGLVRDGDEIHIDLAAGVLDLRINEAELARRRAEHVPPPPRETSGVLAKFAQLATSAAQGALCVARPREIR